MMVPGARSEVAVTEATMEPERTSDDPLERRAIRIGMRRDAAARKAFAHVAIILVIVGVISLVMDAWSRDRHAEKAMAEARAPKPGPQTLTLAKWEPVFTITYEPSPPDGAIRWMDKATIRVKISDTKHRVYSCSGPIEVDGPIADYTFQVEGGKR
jgi:hypothetical protein